MLGLSQCFFVISFEDTIYLFSKKSFLHDPAVSNPWCVAMLGMEGGEARLGVAS